MTNSSSSSDSDDCKGASVGTRKLFKKSAKTKSNRSNTNKQTLSQRKVVQIQNNLNGSYWNSKLNGRRTNGTYMQSLLAYEQTEPENRSSDDESINTELLSESSTWSDSSDADILYGKDTFVTCRSESDTFYLCKILHNVYTYTKYIRIQWCSPIGDDGDDTNITVKTRFELSYTDKLKPDTILMEISKITRHPGDTFSLKKQDIVDTKRLLQKSIHGESMSSDDMMDLSTEARPKKQKHIRFDSTDDGSDNSSSSQTTESSLATKNNKRKKSAKVSKPRKQPAKKRQRTKNVSDDGDDESKPKKKKKKTTVSKAKLFKIRSNSSLEPNETITEYEQEPFFEDNLSVPFISSYVQGKLAIRSVLTNDEKQLKSLINDVNHVSSVHVARSLHTDLSAIHYAIQNDNIKLVKILLDDLKSPKRNRCSFPTVSMKQHNTGRTNIFTFGFHTAPIMASRGVKEGNDALNKGQMEPTDTADAHSILTYALKNNCSREIYDLIIKTFPELTESTYEFIDTIIQHGHRKLAASIIGDIKDNIFHGFNFLHHQVLLYDNEDIEINRTASVIKKARQNSTITPIHCAAINPNAKYLKQLLSMMPEYNILDKYERRPIHFAAACEGSDPLEYLLSKFVNLNDVDRGGNSPLHIAAKTGRAHNVELLLRTAKDKSESNDIEDETVNNTFGLASINRMNKTRFYPVHLAVLENHLNCLEILVEYGANVEVPTSTASGKLTPLMLACQKGYLDIVKYLIEHGAKIENRDRFKRTPLIHACMCGNAHIVSYLLRMGANANVFDSSLNTALHYSIAYGWYFCVQLLIEAGADINCANSWQTTCLAAGFLKGHYGLCDYLLTNHSVNINFQTDDGLTLVMLTVGLPITAAVVEQLEYVVVKHKADCTTIDSSGNNAFHHLAANYTKYHMDKETQKVQRENYIRLCQILLEHNCNPNQLNNNSQSPLMIALEVGNFVLVDYLINQAKITVTNDISRDGKTLLHYFAIKCDQNDLIQALMQLAITDELKKMGQTFDNNGRTPLHYCAEKFHEFCQKNQTSTSTDELKTSYQSIIQMIEYCLESIECDPDAEIKSVENLKEVSKEDSEEEDSEEENEEEQEEDSEDITDPNESQVQQETNTKSKGSSIFYLLSTVPFVGPTEKHPLELFAKKTQKINIPHHENQRTPLLQAIANRQIHTAEILIIHSQCDVNASSSNIANEKQQTPLIFACKLQLLSIVRRLLEHKQCNLQAVDYQNNQALHYFLQTSDRSNDYIEILNLFIEKLKLITKNPLNIRGKSQRTPLHIATYHNQGTIDAITDIEKILIDNGSDLFLEDDLGNLPLHNVFLNKTANTDPVELCVLILESMKYKSLDTKNHSGDTPLHLAVINCSIVCVMLLQQHHADLLIENNQSNSILGTCIAVGHLNLFITFLQQSIDIDLSKTYQLTKTIENKNQTNTIWKWKYLDSQSIENNQRYSLISLIIERDWQGALALILNDVKRFHLKYIDIFEAAIANRKLNLVLRLLQRLKDKYNINEENSRQQNLYHLLANLSSFDENLLKQILIFLSKSKSQWNKPDELNIYPLHYAYVKQNFTFIEFINEKYLTIQRMTPLDIYENSLISLLFWSSGQKLILPKEKLQSLIQSGKQLDCECNYQNQHSEDSLAFDYQTTRSDHILYSSKLSNQPRISPLIHAIVNNNFFLAKFLIELGANINFSDGNQQTPLMYAIRKNNLDIVKLLLNNTYAPKNQVETGSGLFSGFHGRGRGLGRGKRRPRKQFFLGATTDENEQPREKKTAEVFQMTSSVDLNAIDSDGRTCIHHLVQPFTQGTFTNSIEILRLLHSCGASLTKIDYSGYTPLEYSVQMNNQQLISELQKLIHNKKKISMKKLRINHFSVNDPNADLLNTQPNFYDDAQNFIDNYLASHSKGKIERKYPVDPASGMSLTGEVVQDTDKDEPYDVRLNKVDVNYGIFGLYNFYRMQIIKHKSKANLYFLFTRWGRIGTGEGAHQLTPFSSLAECRQEFVKVFREKTGNAWENTDTFEEKPKKYALVQLNQRALVEEEEHVRVNFEQLQDENQHPSSKIQSAPYRTFLRTFLNRQALRQTGFHVSCDADVLPASKLKREVLQQARDILVKLKDLLKQRDELSNDSTQASSADYKTTVKTILDSIYNYSNQYHRLLPVNHYSEDKLIIINDSNQLTQQEKIIEDLFQLELTYKILLGAQANLKRISPIDYIYQSMHCQFEALNQNDFDSQLILRYIWTSAPNVRVKQIFKIARENEDERMSQNNVNNRYLLWHGTNIANLVSILSRGLLCGTMTARGTGNLFGTGIYTADTFQKSLGYCSGVTENKEETCYMLLCEVALGNVKEVGIVRQNTNDEEDENEEDEEQQDEDDDNDFSKPLDLKKYQSRKAPGRQIPDPKHTITLKSGVQMPLGQLVTNPISTYYGLPYNEFIVYNEAQLAIRYLVQFSR